MNATNVNKTPSRPGLVFDPASHRWVGTYARRPGERRPINLRTLQAMSDSALRELQRGTRSKFKGEKNSARFNDLFRVTRIIRSEVRRREVTKAFHKAARMSRRLGAEDILRGTEVLIKGVSIEAAIPIEQLKGDLARAGYQVKSLIALDPEARRLFFMDGSDSPLYAEFSDAAHGFEIQKIGHQREVSKEYDPVDLEADPDDASNLGETVITEHEEREYEEGAPGIIPAGTPGEKPAHDEAYYEGHGYFGEGLGDEGFEDDDRHEGRRDEVAKTMERLDALLR